jgi:LemA protein
MNLVLWIVIGVVLAGLYLLYASIVTKRNRVSEALASIDVQLTQRHDLIPNVLAIAKRFMEHERGLMDDVTALRTKASASVGVQDPAKIAEKFEAENQLGAQLGKLMAVAESYPALKSDGPMIEAQKTYEEVETNIAAARRFYNSAVGDLRNAVQIFPGALVAGLAGAGTPPPFFEAAAGDRAPVDAASLLGAQ